MKPSEAISAVLSMDSTKSLHPGPLLPFVDGLGMALIHVACWCAGHSDFGTVCQRILATQVFCKDENIQAQLKSMLFLH